MLLRRLIKTHHTSFLILLDTTKITNLLFSLTD